MENEEELDVKKLLNQEGYVDALCQLQLESVTEVKDPVDLMNQLQTFWDKFGRTDEDRNKFVAEIEYECQILYQMKLEKLLNLKKERLEEFSSVQSEIEKIYFEITGDMSDQTHVVDCSERNWNAYRACLQDIVKEKTERLLKVQKFGSTVQNLCSVLSRDISTCMDVLAEIDAECQNVYKMKIKKLIKERIEEFSDVQSEIQKICLEITGDISDQTPVVDFSEGNLNACQAWLQELEKEKAERSLKVEEFVSTLQNFCSVLSRDRSTIMELHPSLKESNGVQPKCISNDTLIKLANIGLAGKEEKMQMLEKLTGLAEKLLQHSQLKGLSQDQGAAPHAQLESQITPLVELEGQGAAPQVQLEGQGADPQVQLEDQGAAQVQLEGEGAAPQVQLEDQGAAQVQLEGQGADQLEGQGAAAQVNETRTQRRQRQREERLAASRAATAAGRQRGRVRQILEQPRRNNNLTEDAIGVQRAHS